MRVYGSPSLAHAWPPFKCIMLMLLLVTQMTKATTTALLRAWELTNKQFTQIAAKYFLRLSLSLC